MNMTMGADENDAFNAVDQRVEVRFGPYWTRSSLHECGPPLLGLVRSSTATGFPLRGKDTRMEGVGTTLPSDERFHCLILSLERIFTDNAPNLGLFSRRFKEIRCAGSLG